MANLTITVDEEILKQARIRALREGTSVKRLLRERLESYVENEDRRQKAIRDLLRSSRAARSGSAGRRVRRDRISFWDALILVAASTAGCEGVLSEDLQHGRSFGKVRIADPFRD